jgi:hypothetical protein
MLKHIAEFFAIEKDIRGRSAKERHFIRQQRGWPLADAFQKWLGIAGMRQRVAVQRGILRQRPSQVCDTNIHGDSATVLRGGVRAVITVFGHSDDSGSFLRRSCTSADDRAKQKQREHNQPT